MEIPEFILRKLFVEGSLKAESDGFSFSLCNTFAPGTVTSMMLEVDGQPVPLDALTLQLEADPAPRPAGAISAEEPFVLPVGTIVRVRARGIAVPQERLGIRVDTREAGPLAFSVHVKGKRAGPAKGQGLRLPRWRRRPLKAEVEVDLEKIIGAVNPHVYGHFVEHLEYCVYGGVWTADGSRLREDTLELIRALRPPVIRYPGGNFASGYHWEDGIGPRQQRPRRFDKAWNSWESNAVGTDEFMTFCSITGADPFLVVNDGSGTPDEAARWVAYCNDSPATGMGRLRAGHGRAEPYSVRLWGVGNEVWGQWQIGHTGANEYAARLRRFVTEMKRADPNIRIVAVGDGAHTDAADDPARLWNEVVLRLAGDLIDYLSFHIYQPNQEGWKESYEPESLHHTVCAAPLDVEEITLRMAGQIRALAPGSDIHVALDEWNLWLSPPPGAQTMHRLVYTQRDALYVAGMLNVFHRCCRALTLANLAQLVNVLPAIVTDRRRAVPTAIYFPFLLYRQMERIALQTQVHGPTFDSEALGNIRARHGVPYLDVTATRDEGARRLVLGVVNRHPELPVDARIVLRGLEPSAVRGWQLSSPDPSTANSLEAPGRLRVRDVPPGDVAIRKDTLIYRFPAAAVTVIAVERA